MRPFTGKEFLDSLRDGREIWIYGQRVPDVTAHPAFRNPARMVARLYDALHDAASRDVLTCPTDTGSGDATIQGPGDLAAVNLEGVFFFDSFSGSKNQGWNGMIGDSTFPRKTQPSQDAALIGVSPAR